MPKSAPTVAWGRLLFRILFLVSCIILAWAPTEVFKAAFLCADAPRTNPDVKACDGPDGGGLAYFPDGVCTRDWLTRAECAEARKKVSSK